MKRSGENIERVHGRTRRAAAKAVGGGGVSAYLSNLIGALMAYGESGVGGAFQ